MKKTRLQQDFRCLHCKSHVSVSHRLSGVQNRNHCPYCLWSRHVDLTKAGDREADCQGPMEPVGLTLKSTRKKYSSPMSGELMVIHRCTGCGKISINRIAADDDARLILQVFDNSKIMDASLRLLLEQQGIHLLGPAETEIVSIRLFGKR